MKKITRLNHGDIKIGREYEVAERFTCEPFATVKVLEMVDNTVLLVCMAASHHSFSIPLKDYSIFDTPMEATIAHLYVRQNYLIRRFQEISVLSSNEFFWLYRHYLGLGKLYRQSR